MPRPTGEPFYLLNGGKWGQLYSCKSTGLSKLGRAQKKNSPMMGQEHLKTEDYFSPPKTQVNACSCLSHVPSLGQEIWVGESQAVVMFQQHPTPKGRGGLLWPFRGRGATTRQKSTLWRPGLTWWWAQGCPHGWSCRPPWATLIVYNGGQSPRGASSCFYPQTAILQSNIPGMPLH